MANKLYTCITTIQPPTEAVQSLHRALMVHNGRMVVAGDKKGPSNWNLEHCDFLSLDDQLHSSFGLATVLPVGHYARKNIAYLHAMRSGATCIYETDDDNAPLDSWAPRSQNVSNVRTLSACQPSSLSGFSSQWVNVYRYFTPDNNIWPRGLPLAEIQNDLSAFQHFSISDVPFLAPVQQGLVNGSPDVDAVWRLTQDRPFEFDQKDPVRLGPGLWCPFNTQSTWWFPKAYPLMYVPSYCSFRMCDIWKSFVAQRCLWAMGFGMVFHAPEVFQQRNEHNLMKDFEDEVPGYLNNSRIADLLSGLDLQGDPPTDMRTCYAALMGEGFFPEKELVLVDCWLNDLEAVHG